MNYQALQRDALCTRRAAILDFLSMLACEIRVFAYDRIRRRVYDLEDAIDAGDTLTFECIAAQIASMFADELGLDAYTRLRALADDMQRACYAGDLATANQLQAAFDAMVQREVRWP